MPGGMTFRKDCAECGRSFLTPDKKAKICQRCAGKGHPNSLQEAASPEGATPKGAGKTQKHRGATPPSGPVESPTARTSKPSAARESRPAEAGPEEQQAPPEKIKAVPKKSPPAAKRKKEVIELSPEQIQEIADRYQKYVEVLERPPIGRRKTIAAVMGLTYPRVVLGLRQWNQRQAQVENLVRKQRFAIEKIYFSYLEEQISFPEVKARIVQATGLVPWSVARYLDLLHDGERKVRNVPPVSPEQEKAILEEYRNYLSASGPPEPPLHTLIAERTGVLPKQVYRVLLAYRLSRFHEKWS